MEDILSKISQLNLTYSECDIFKDDLVKLLNKKASDSIISEFIHNFKITEHFDILTDYLNVKYSRSLVFGLVYTIEFLSEPTHSWETYVWIHVDEKSEKVTNIIYQTDRYVIYDHDKRLKSPDGDFQDQNIDEVYKDRPERLHKIRNDIANVKRLCDFLIL